MNDELRAAAETIAFGNYGAFDLPPREQRLWTAAGKMARAYLAANPADDATPVDEAWLSSLGFTIRNGTVIKVETEGAWKGRALIRATATSPRWIYQQPRCWDTGGDDGETAYVPAPKTRGEVRRLCASLGIALRESPA